MNRKVLALLLTALVAVSLTACSKKDSATIVDDESTSTTSEKSTTTTEEEDEETTTTTSAGLSPKIDLGGLGTSSDDADIDSDVSLSSAESDCVDEEVAADPFLSDYTSFEEIQATSQTDLEAFYEIFVDCIGVTKAVDLFMSGVASDPTVDAAAQVCVRSIVESLSYDEVVQLFAENPEVTEAVRDVISSECNS